MELSKLQELIFEAGIVGAGGAGFPTHKKLAKEVKQIIVNAAECEPLMMVDHYLLSAYFKEITEALSELKTAMGAEEVIIGIKGKNIKLLDKAVLKNLKDIKIAEIPDIYPAGDEVILIYETTGKIVPEGAIPLAVGVMVINVETVFNIYNKLVNNENASQKFVSIGGDVPEDMVVKVPVGMKIKDFLAEAGYDNLEGKAVINGGPMMGKLVNPETDVITKTTKGILIFPEFHSVVQRRRANASVTLKRAAAACCGCHMCSDMCSRRLLGYHLNVDKTIRAASHGEVRNVSAFLDTALCSGCGLCTAVACQQMLDPQKISTMVKAELAKQGFKRRNNVTPETVRPERDGRLVPSEVLIDRLGIRRFKKDNVEFCDVKFEPKTVYIPFSQHIGKPAAALVSVGDKVKTGQKIAQTEPTALGTTIHASINGTVKEITEKYAVIER